MWKAMVIIVISWILGITLDVFYGAVIPIGAACWCIGALGGFFAGLQYNDKEEK